MQLHAGVFTIFMKNAESGGLSLTAVSLTSFYSRRHREWEEVQYYCIDYFQLYFHWTLALDHLYRKSFRDLHYLSLSSAAVINLSLSLSLSLSLLWSLRGVSIWLQDSHSHAISTETQIVFWPQYFFTRFPYSHDTSCISWSAPVQRSAVAIFLHNQRDWPK